MTAPNLQVLDSAVAADSSEPELLPLYATAAMGEEITALFYSEFQADRFTSLKTNERPSLTKRPTRVDGEGRRVFVIAPRRTKKVRLYSTSDAALAAVATGGDALVAWQLNPSDGEDWHWPGVGINYLGVGQLTPAGWPMLAEEDE